MQRRRGMRYAARATGIALLAGLTVACNPKVTPPGFGGVVVHIVGGESTAHSIDISAVKIVTLDIHPRNSTLTATATGGTVTVNGQAVTASILAYGSDQSHAGDLTATFEKCVQIKPGKDIKVDYAFTNTEKKVLEQGSVYLSEVVGTCP